MISRRKDRIKNKEIQMDGETLLDRGGGADAYLYAKSLATQTYLRGRIRGVDVWCLTGVCILHSLNEVCSSMKGGWVKRHWESAGLCYGVDCWK